MRERWVFAQEEYTDEVEYTAEVDPSFVTEDEVEYTAEVDPSFVTEDEVEYTAESDPSLMVDGSSDSIVNEDCVLDQSTDQCILEDNGAVAKNQINKHLFLPSLLFLLYLIHRAVKYPPFLLIASLLLQTALLRLTLHYCSS